MAYDYDLICIGSGPAGQRAAIQAAKLGKKVAVVEKRNTVGGICVDLGTIPSKTFREAVLYFTSMAGRFETRQVVRGGSRPGAAELLAKVDETIQAEEEVVERQLRRNDVTVVRGEASFVDPHTIGVKVPNAEGKLSAEFVFLGVGTQPAKPRGIE